MKRFIALIVLLHTAFATNQLSFGEGVYNSLPFIDGHYGTFVLSSVEAGQTITLEGNARRVMRVDLALSSGQPSDFVVRFYEMNGVGGKPGSLIWQSSPQPYPFTPNTFPNPNEKVVSVDVGGVLVPETFAIVATNYPQRAVMALLLSNPPSIGTGHNSWVRFQGPPSLGWQIDSTDTGYYGFRVDAVPEPNVVVLVLTSLMFYAFTYRAR